MFPPPVRGSHFKVQSSKFKVQGSEFNLHLDIACSLVSSRLISSHLTAITPSRPRTLALILTYPSPSLLACCLPSSGISRQALAPIRFVLSSCLLVLSSILPTYIHTYIHTCRYLRYIHVHTCMYICMYLLASAIGLVTIYFWLCLASLSFGHHRLLLTYRSRSRSHPQALSLSPSCFFNYDSSTPHNAPISGDFQSLSILSLIIIIPSLTRQPYSYTCLRSCHVSIISASPKLYRATIDQNSTLPPDPVYKFSGLLLHFPL
ncbi:hypothetical protein F4859DRAFT_144383 [Xylaria cf. heliscus]|nr:hypothetical protein F4859DRAFT_144383 [Xylaria cf. heliscus]